MMDLATELLKEIKNYNDHVKEAVEKAIVDVAKESQKELKSAGDFKGNEYRKSWSVKKESKKGVSSATVYNKEHYRLTHLLENGHAIKGGKGRKETKGKTTAFVHISPVNEKAQKELEERIKEAIESYA